MKFIGYLKDGEVQIFVLDEAGFGTKALKHYAYSQIGTPAIQKVQKLGINLSCIATISTTTVEAI